tara:strand:+ start:2008 stop:2397 length:390 start_codon:yes stop_codon:yes gene_type:complete
VTHIREQTVRGLKAGDVFTVTRTFTENDTVTFGEISRDMNPIHYDEHFAAAKGFRGKICHGLLVGGMITEVGGQIGWLASGMNFRFRRPVYLAIPSPACSPLPKQMSATAQKLKRCCPTNMARLLLKPG